MQDDDGAAYLLYSSEGNAVLHITQLAADYLDVTANYTRALVGLNREAPAMFKHAGRYYLLTSGCTGWEPNRAGVYSAPRPDGPWAKLGDPCRAAADKTCAAFFRSQSERASRLACRLSCLPACLRILRGRAGLLPCACAARRPPDAPSAPPPPLRAPPPPLRRHVCAARAAPRPPWRIYNDG